LVCDQYSATRPAATYTSANPHGRIVSAARFGLAESKSRTETTIIAASVIDIATRRTSSRIGRCRRSS